MLEFLSDVLVWLDIAYFILRSELLYHLIYILNLGELFSDFVLFGFLFLIEFILHAFLLPPEVSHW